MKLGVLYCDQVSSWTDSNTHTHTHSVRWGKRFFMRLFVTVEMLPRLTLHVLQLQRTIKARWIAMLCGAGWDGWKGVAGTDRLLPLTTKPIFVDFSFFLAGGGRDIAAKGGNSKQWIPVVQDPSLLSSLETKELQLQCSIFCCKDVSWHWSRCGNGCIRRRCLGRLTIGKVVKGMQKICIEIANLVTSICSSLPARLRC